MAVLVVAAVFSFGPTRPAGAARRPARARAHRSPCAAHLGGVVERAGRSHLIVTVLDDSMRSTHAVVGLYLRHGACLHALAGPYPARVGALGLSARHREGVPTTPTGSFAIEPVMYGTGPDPGLAYRYHRIVCGDWWDEDPDSGAYNRFVHRRCGTDPGFSGEALWLAGPAYRYLAVIAYNTSPVVKGRGSGIFLHVDTGAATAGCVSLAEPALVRILRRLRPDDHPRVVIGTRAGLAHA